MTFSNVCPKTMKSNATAALVNKATAWRAAFVDLRGLLREESVAANRKQHARRHQVIGIDCAEH